MTVKKKDKKAEKGKDNDEIDVTPPYRINIKTATDIRRLLVSIINQLRGKSIDTQRARAIIYAGSVLLSVFSQVDLESRVKELEELAGYGGRRR